MTNRIIFVGYMGAGKTIAAQTLQSKTGLDSVDLDAFFIQKSGGSIASFMSTHGELKFREYEAELLHFIVKESGHRIIACGGGTPCLESSSQLIQRSGHVVHLNLPFESLLVRLQDDQQRPLLPRNSGLLDEVALHQHWKRRLPCYDLAHEVIGHVPREEDYLRWGAMLIGNR